MSEAKKTVRTMSGTVVSDKMDKTITVKIVRRVKHPVYGKYINRTNTLHAHDAENECHEGDLVTIEETRPISKTKTWKLGSIDRKAATV